MVSIFNQYCIDNAQNVNNGKVKICLFNLCTDLIYAFCTDLIYALCTDLIYALHRCYVIFKKSLF